MSGPDSNIQDASSSESLGDMPDPAAFTPEEAGNWIQRFMWAFPSTDPRAQFARELGERVKNFVVAPAPAVDPASNADSHTHGAVRPQGSSHLWEVEHPYYASEGCFHKSGYHVKYDSWADFAELEGSNDCDLNFAYRWDWHKPGFPLTEPDLRSTEELLIFFVLQRKGFCRSVGITVTESDEPAVREWLSQRAITTAAVWAPIEVRP